MSTTQKTLMSGVFYNAVAKYSGVVISLVVTGILSRLLPPSDFGIVAVAMVIITFFSFFSDMGIGPAIIQYKDLSPSDLDHIFSLTVWSGLFFAGLFFAGSWPIAAYYDSETLRPICQLLSVNLFFSAVNIVPNALLFKEKRFRFIAGRTLFVQSTVGVLACTAAWSGAGIYALLINPILSGIILFAVNFRQHPLRLRLRVNTAPIRRIFSFSSYQFLFNVFNYFTRNLDKLLVGKYMGMAPLGFYEKSYRLMMLPLQNITHVVSPVMHPVFSEFQHDLRRLADSYTRVVRVLAFIGLPLSAMLFFTSRELVLLIFGEQWTASVPVFHILTLSVGIQIVLSTSGPVFQAAGATRMMFLSGLLSAVLNVAAICIGIFHFRTIEAVAACICVSFAVNFVQSYYLLYRCTLKQPWGPFWKQFLSPLVLTALLSAALWATSQAMTDTRLLVSLIVKGIAALVLYAAYIQFSGTYDIRKKITDILTPRSR